LIKSESSLKQSANSSSASDATNAPGPGTAHTPHFSPRSKWSVLPLLSLVVIFLLVFAGQFVNAMLQVTSPAAQVAKAFGSLLQGRGGYIMSPFELPAHRTMLYEQQGNIYSFTTYSDSMIDQDSEATAQATPDVISQPFQLQTPGYIYSRSVSPVVTPAGKLIYAGTGLWETDFVHNQPQQIATIGDDQEITSLALSHDGTQLSWSSTPKDGQGETQIFAGPIGATKLVYQQKAGQCPCLRVFSFWPASGAKGNNTLLLTDDHGDDGPVQHGLWILPISAGPSVEPALVIQSDPPQGPLTLSALNTTLLYTTYEGNVPVPDNLPSDLATVGYANSLVVASLQNTAPYLKNTHVVLPEQSEQRNNAQYHWVLSPTFSPDGQTLLYVEFSADSQGSFARTNALYMVQMHGSVAPARPALVATTGAHYIELGSWWDAHTVTVFIDNALYALDIEHGNLTKIVSTYGYAHEIAVLN
jgi:hypothetical protein